MKPGILIVAAIGLVAVAVAFYFAFGQEEKEISVAQPGTATTESSGVSPPPQPESGSHEPAEESASEELVTAEPAEAVAEDTATQSSPSQSAAVEPSGTSSADGTAAATVGSGDVATAPSTGSEAEPLPSAPKPKASFDLVRVEKSGEAVIAGRGPAGSRVTIFDGDAPLGSVIVGPSGGWVVLPADPLSPGSHHLSIRAVLADGSEVWSENTAVVEVPEPAVRVAAVPSPQPAPDEAEDTQTSETGAAQTAVADTASSGAASVDSGAVEAASTENEVAGSGVVDQVGPLVVLVPNNPEQPSEVLQIPETTAEQGIRQDSLSLETVDYDDAGKAVISGRATPGTTILIYLDNLAVADTIVESDGRWSVRPESPISPGLHRLRVDQLGADGAVLARVETPFARAEVEEIQVAQNRVVVQPGNSLWRIARRVYGEGIRYTVIYQANSGQIGDPDLTYPGQIFSLPSTD